VTTLRNSLPIVAFAAVGFVSANAFALTGKDFMCEDNGLKFSYQRLRQTGPKGSQVEICWFTMTSCGHVLEHYQVPPGECEKNGARRLQGRR
jgi:hypothetical protein